MGKLINVGVLVLVGHGVWTGCDGHEPVEGGPCVEGQRSACARDNLAASCGSCQGHWLECINGKWFAVHCDPVAPPDPRPDAAIDSAGRSSDAADVPLLPDVQAIDVPSIDTSPAEAGAPN